MSDRAYVSLGWWLFVGCAAFFVWASARSGDLLALIGSILFMAGNVAFLIPHLRHSRGDLDE